MRIDVRPITELSEEMKQRWLDIQSLNSNLSGPCFHPDLFRSVGKFCQDVYVALLYDKNDLIGFLPYLKDQKLSVAQPIEFCDYQAIIGPRSYPWDLRVILKHIGLRSWNYTSLVDFENIKSKGRQLKIGGSRRIDLNGGYEEYRLSKKDGKVKFGGLRRKKKLVQANLGPITFVPMSNDREVLRQMLYWKSLQHNRDSQWLKLATELVEHFSFSDQSAIKGVLCGLYAENNLMAAFFGIRYQGILHSLICAFNPDFKKFSPGLILWQSLISAHQKLEYTILDLGPGDNKYKSYFSNSTFPIMKRNCTDTAIKEKIKSVKWLYRGLEPVVQSVRKVMRGG